MKKTFQRGGFDVIEMLELRRQGWSTPALGRKYGKDHTTIIYHCRKFNIQPSGPSISLKFVLEKKNNLPREVKPPEPPPPPAVHKYDYLINEMMYAGKTAKQYQQDALQRPVESHYAAHLRVGGKGKKSSTPRAITDKVIEEFLSSD